MGALGRTHKDTCGDLAQVVIALFLYGISDRVVPEQKGVLLLDDVLTVFSMLQTVDSEITSRGSGL